MAPSSSSPPVQSASNSHRPTPNFSYSAARNTVTSPKAGFFFVRRQHISRRTVLSGWQLIGNTKLLQIAPGIRYDQMILPCSSWPKLKLVIFHVWRFCTRDRKGFWSLSSVLIGSTKLCQDWGVLVLIINALPPPANPWKFSGKSFWQ
jgi:hypothetical protein